MKISFWRKDSIKHPLNRVSNQLVGASHVFFMTWQHFASSSDSSFIVNDVRHLSENDEIKTRSFRDLLPYPNNAQDSLKAWILIALAMWQFETWCSPEVIKLLGFADSSRKSLSEFSFPAACHRNKQKKNRQWK